MVDTTPEQQELLEKSQLPDGTVSNVFRVLLHNPTLTRRFNAYAGFFMRSSTLSRRTRELIIMRVAWRTQCLYEFAHHRRYAVERDLVSSEELRALVEAGSSDWADEDQAVIEAVDQLVQSNVVDDEGWDALSRHVTEDQATEILLLVGLYAALAGLIRTLRIPLEEEFSLAEQEWAQAR